MNVPRKRVILAWHRWLGILSAIFLLSVSITGLVLNHTERLGLDSIKIRNDFILNQYGMASGSQISAYPTEGDNFIAHLDGQLFYNTDPLVPALKPISIVQSENLSVILTTDSLILLTPEGQLAEKLSATELPWDALSAVGKNENGETILVGSDGNWQTNPSWIDFEPYEGSYSVTPLSSIELTSEQRNELLANYQGEGVPLYRVLLDLHSGRLFGWGGRTLMDLSAIAVILLVSSGLLGWLRKSRRISEPKSDS